MDSLRIDACASFVGGLAFALVASTAAANGRFPRAQRLIQDRQNPDVMALYGTYGLLVTRDAGASWRHVCEAATGAYAGEDPLLEIMADERLVLRTDMGLARSDASFCSYEAVLGSARDALQDITRDSATPNGLLALSTALGDDGVIVSSLSSSTDGGATFTPLGRVPPDVLRLGLTVDVSANLPERVYISGFDDLGRGNGRMARALFYYSCTLPQGSLHDGSQRSGRPGAAGFLGEQAGPDRKTLLSDGDFACERDAQAVVSAGHD